MANQRSGEQMMWVPVGMAPLGCLVMREDTRPAPTEPENRPTTDEAASSAATLYVIGVAILLLGLTVVAHAG